jgi:hypothetical protein
MNMPSFAAPATSSRLSSRSPTATPTLTGKSFVRCDMTEEFPFLVTKLSPYYDR